MDVGIAAPPRAGDHEEGGGDALPAVREVSDYRDGRELRAEEPGHADVPRAGRHVGGQAERRQRLRLPAAPSVLQRVTH